MIRHLAWLLARTVRNRLVRQAGQLRRPRYALALLAGLAYLWVLLGTGSRPGSVVARPAWAETAAGAGLLLAALWSWLAPGRVLAFSLAEVHLLFPAPITRRALIHYKLLRTQLLLWTNALLWTFLFSAEPLGPGLLRRSVALWALLTTLDLHRVGAALTRTSLSQARGAAWRRAPVMILAPATAALLLGGSVLLAAPELHRAALTGGREVGQALLHLAGTPPLSLLLTPFRLLARPLWSDDAVAWASDIGAALLVLGAHYLWVLRADAAFEETSVEAGLSPKRSVAAPVVPLGARWSPTGAIVWKNVTAVLRRRRLLLYVAAFVAAGSGLAGASLVLRGGLADAVGIFVGLWGVFLIVMGPQWVRVDLRADLLNLDLLRTLPLTGRQVATAELAAATLLVTAAQVAALALGWLGLVGSRGFEPDLATRTLALVLAAVLLPGVNWTSLALLNGTALMFPAWFRPGGVRPGRVEALGLTMLTTIALLAGLGVLLVPAALSGWGAATTLRATLGAPGWAAALAGGAAAALVLAAQGRLLAGRVGALYETVEPPPPAEAGG